LHKEIPEKSRLGKSRQAFHAAAAKVALGAARQFKGHEPGTAA